MKGGKIVKNDITTTSYKSSYPTKGLVGAGHFNTTYCLSFQLSLSIG